jgi:hypothetical protein
MRLHEKGGVEGEIGRFRRTHLVPVPNVASLAELSVLMAAGDADDTRVTTGRPSSRPDPTGYAPAERPAAPAPADPSAQKGTRP